jgi:hypothetical protein
VTNSLAAAVSEPALHRLLTFQIPNLMSLLCCLGCTKLSVQVRGFVCEYFVTKIHFHGEELLAPCPTPKLEDHTLSAVRDCLFNIFAATLHIVGRSSIRNLRKCHAVVTSTPLSHGFMLLKDYQSHKQNVVWCMGNLLVPSVFCLNTVKCNHSSSSVQYVVTILAASAGSCLYVICDTWGPWCGPQINTYRYIRRLETHWYRVENKEYTAINSWPMVLQRRWRDNARPAPNACINSGIESSSRCVGGAANC